MNLVLSHAINCCYGHEEVTAVISPNQGGKQLGNTSIINRNPGMEMLIGSNVQ